jgi:hypothetical protein
MCRDLAQTGHATRMSRMARGGTGQGKNALLLWEPNPPNWLFFNCQHLPYGFKDQLYVGSIFLGLLFKFV